MKRPKHRPSDLTAVAGLKPVPGAQAPTGFTTFQVSQAAMTNAANDAASLLVQWRKEGHNRESALLRVAALQKVLLDLDNGNTTFDEFTAIQCGLRRGFEKTIQSKPDMGNAGPNLIIPG